MSYLNLEIYLDLLFETTSLEDEQKYNYLKERKWTGGFSYENFHIISNAAHHC